MKNDIIFSVGNGLLDLEEEVLSLIDKCTDNSERSNGKFSMDRLLIEFKNGCRLSIIRGEYAYCDANSFEIMPFLGKNFSKEERLAVYDEEDQDIEVDDVIGYCSLEKVSGYIKRIAYL